MSPSPSTSPTCSRGPRAARRAGRARRIPPAEVLQACRAGIVSSPGYELLPARWRGCRPPVAVQVGDRQGVKRAVSEALRQLLLPPVGPLAALVPEHIQLRLGDVGVGQHQLWAAVAVEVRGGGSHANAWRPSGPSAGSRASPVEALAVPVSNQGRSGRRRGPIRRPRRMPGRRDGAVDARSDLVAHHGPRGSAGMLNQQRGLRAVRGSPIIRMSAGVAVDVGDQDVVCSAAFSAKECARRPPRGASRVAKPHAAADESTQPSPSTSRTARPTSE